MMHDVAFGNSRRRYIAVIAVAVASAAATAVGAGAQRFRGRSVIQARNPDYDGAFTFCRIMFRQNPYGDGDGWSVDYPRADINLSYRLSELTSTKVSKSPEGEFN